MNELIYHENKQLLAGPAGQLEMLCDTAEHAPNNIAAIVCHPHPLFGGTMQNKVVTTLVKAYRELGLKYIIRFNFRGVGQSSGTYAEGIGEQLDLQVIVDWVRQYTPTIWLAGFSFGSYVAASAAGKINCQHLTCVAPPVERFDFTAIANFTCPWLVVQGEQDEVVAPAAVFQWLAKLTHQPTIIRLPEASHFFHGQLINLRTELTQQLRQFL